MQIALVMDQALSQAYFLVQYIYGKQTYGSLVDGCLDRLACWPRPARPWIWQPRYVSVMPLLAWDLTTPLLWKQVALFRQDLFRLAVYCCWQRHREAKRQVATRSKNNRNCPTLSKNRQRMRGRGHTFFFLNYELNLEKRVVRVGYLPIFLSTAWLGPIDQPTKQIVISFWKWGNLGPVIYQSKPRVSVQKLLILRSFGILKTCLVQL